MPAALSGVTAQLLVRLSAGQRVTAEQAAAVRYCRVIPTEQLCWFWDAGRMTGHHQLCLIPTVADPRSLNAALFAARLARCESHWLRYHRPLSLLRQRL